MVHVSVYTHSDVCTWGLGEGTEGPNYSGSAASSPTPAHDLGRAEGRCQAQTLNPKTVAWNDVLHRSAQETTGLG